VSPLQDDQTSVLRISGAERLHLVAIAVKMNEPGADGVVEHRADEIAEQAAGENRVRAAVPKTAWAAEK
jgi:hypothetical protein